MAERGQRNNGMLRVVGIDPGLAGTGIGMVEGDGRVVSGYAFGSISTLPENTLVERLSTIYEKSLAYLCRQKPDLVVIEDIFSLGKYPASGITLGKVTGVLLLAAGRAGARVTEIQVREAKKVVTGTGAADKYQVERSVRNLLSHGDRIRPFHASDALALALAGFFRRG